MKRFVLPLAVVFSALCLCGCGDFGRWAFATEKRTSSVPREIATFKGEVVYVSVGYRFKPSEEPENLRRLTKAKSGNNYEAKEINLRKYLGKTLTVRGESEGGWILEADIIGQWLRPGEMSGSNLTGPKQ
jgi:hypothetical protein